MSNGFSHIGVATHDMSATIHFYEVVLGFRRIAGHDYLIREGGTMRLAFFDLGDGQFIVFMEPQGIRGIPTDFDTGINAGLGVPKGVYHLAFKVRSMAELLSRRQILQTQQINVSDVVDHGYAKSFFFHDPNNIELEFYFQSRPFDETDLNQSAEVSMVLRE